jgi:hypothetical protein
VKEKIYYSALRNSKNLPPFNVPVCIKVSDYMGDCELDHKLMRKEYKTPPPGKKKKGWRWVTTDGTRSVYHDDIVEWRYEEIKEERLAGGSDE